MPTSTTIKSVEAFQVSWEPNEPPGRRTAFVRVTTTDGIVGHGEASPMMGGEHSLGVVSGFRRVPGRRSTRSTMRCISDRLLHKYIKLGPEGAVTGALAALDIALWDIKGKFFNLPIYKLLGGAWRTEIPFYASIGDNACRTVDETLRAVEERCQVGNAGARSRSAGMATGRARTSTFPATSPR